MSGSVQPGQVLPSQVSASMYPAPQPAPLMNGLQYQQGYAELQARNLANQQAQQALAAQNAIGKAVQGSIDPSTGKPDLNKALLTISSDPQAAFGAAGFLKQAIDSGQIQAETAKTTLANQLNKNTAMMQAVAPLIAKGQNVTQGDVISSLGGLVANGVVQSDEALKYAQGLGNTPAQLVPHIQQLSDVMQGAAETQKQLLGQFATVQTGNGTQTMYVGPRVGQGNYSTTPNANPGAPNPGFIPDQPSVAARNNPMGTVGQNGEIKPKPQQSVMPMYDGNGKLVPGTGGPSDAPELQTQLSIPAEQTLKVYEPQLQQRAATAAASNRSINEQLSLLDQFKSGGGMSGYGKIAQTLQSMGVPKPLTDAVAAGSLPAFQEAQKLAAVSAMQTLVSSAGGAANLSTSEYQTFKDNLPNADTDPQAAKNMLLYMQRANQLTLQEQKAYAAYKRSGGDPGQWQALYSEAMQKSKLYQETIGAKKSMLSSVNPTGQ